MTKQQAIEQGIKLIQGQEQKIGDLVAHPSYDTVCELVSYDNDIAIVYDGKQTLKFPKSELFNPKKLANVANHLFNLGFWQEGMESSIITLKS